MCVCVCVCVCLDEHFAAALTCCSPVAESVGVAHGMSPVLECFLRHQWDTFQEIDTSHDKRINQEEFVKGCGILGGAKIEDPQALFHSCDKNAGESSPQRCIIVTCCPWP